MGEVSPALGQRIGPYELVERLGSGGMAEVYVARRRGPRGFEKKLAIKRILPQLARDSRFVAMFCDEARICAALSHPNIVQVVDFGEHDGQLFMAMEYIEGVSCARLLRAVAARGKRFPIGGALFVAHEVLRGLRFAHEARDERGRALGIVHRDVSPGNILIGTGGEVKLTDFGIVLSAFVDRRTYPGELKGKMGYMSPEQVIGEELDRRSDLFTLAIVLAEMLLARPLFPGRTELDMLTSMYRADLSVLDRFGAELPPDLLEVLRVALAREKERRFQSARDFEDALGKVARKLDITLNDTQLAPWLANLGIMPGRSGTRAAAEQPAARPRLRFPPPEAEAAPPTERRAGRPPPATTRAPSLASGPSYKVRTESGSERGPFNLPQMLGLAATGRLRPDAAVSLDDEPYQPAIEVPALAQLMRRPAYGFAVDPSELALWQRPLRRRYLPSTLFELARRGESGLLLARRDDRQKRIYMRDGVPEFVASTQSSELLGSILVRDGLVGSAEVAVALLRCVQKQERLGEALIGMGLLRPAALLRSLNDQLEARFMELASWEDGQLLFVAGAVHGEAGIKPQSSGVALVARALHTSYDDDEISDLLESCRQQPIARVATEVDVTELQLTPHQHRAVELAPGALSLDVLVEQLARQAGVRPQDTLRGVFIGLCSGMLETPGWP